MAFLLKNWKNILITILLVIVYFSFRTCKQNKSYNNALENKLDSTYLKASYYKDKSDRLVAQVNVQQLTINELKQVWENDSRKLKRQVGNLKNLVGYWNGSASKSDTVIIELTDTIYISNGSSFNKSFEWSNKNLYVKGMVGDKLLIDYQYQVDFELTSYYRRRFFKRTLVADIYFSDPKLIVRDFKGVVIKEDRRRVGLGFGVGYGFVFDSGLKTGFGGHFGLNIRL